MFECECVPRCLFFHDQMASMPSTAELVKSQYCAGPRADNTRCARHMVFVVHGSEGVPEDLFPSDIARAQEIIAK